MSPTPRDCRIGEKTQLSVRGPHRFSVGGDGHQRHLSPGKLKSTNPSLDKRVTFKYPANPSPANEAQGGAGLLPGIKSSGLK